tara:strand:- start:212 stop:715 length:504 start_codon:yes stop_codon:yes gene_type:complete
MKRFVPLFITLFIIGAVSTPTQAFGKKKIKEGRKVTVNYTVKNEAGEVVDTTEGKEALEYVHGESPMLDRVQEELKGMTKGETKTFVLQPIEAYGEYLPNAVHEYPKEFIPEEWNVTPGFVVRFQDANGKQVVALVRDVKEENVVLDFNHPLAGKTLTYKVEVEEVK